MKNIVLLFLIICLIGCYKEQEGCKDYQMFIESTEASAQAKCRGLANSHPEWKVIQVRVLSCLTEDQLWIAQSTGRTVTQQMCPGVEFSVRTIIR